MAGNDQKAYLHTESGKKLPCLFNPASLEISLSASWEGKGDAKLNAPNLSYQGGQSGTMSVELFLDTSADGSVVTKHTDELIKLTRIDTSLPQGQERPPYVTFHWGRFHSFKGVVSDLSITYELFRPNGEPIRARVSLTLTQAFDEDNWPPQNPTSGTPRPARSHQVVPGETLDRIAATHYGDPTEWRRLAAANGVKDPFLLRPGSRIDVPTMEA